MLGEVARSRHWLLVHPSLLSLALTLHVEVTISWSACGSATVKYKHAIDITKGRSNCACYMCGGGGVKYESDRTKISELRFTPDFEYTTSTCVTEFKDSRSSSSSEIALWHTRYRHSKTALWSLGKTAHCRKCQANLAVHFHKPKVTLFSYLFSFFKAGGIGRGRGGSSRQLQQQTLLSLPDTSNKDSPQKEEGKVSWPTQ